MPTFASVRPLPALILCALLLCALTLPVRAATLYVSPVGSDDNSGAIASPYKTIQAAVNNASDSDSVTLEDGTYAAIGDRDVDLKGKNITINSVDGASKTIIDCGGTKQDLHRAFYLHTKETDALHGIAIENGCNSKGGAIDIELGCSVKLIDCAFMNNTSTESSGFAGGGAILNRGTADVINCTFTKNGAGAIYSDGALSLAHCVFSGNTERGSGGALCNRGKATVTSSQFIGNKADRDGGAIYSPGTMTIADSTFSGNTVGTPNDGNGDGGAIFSGNNTTLTNCVLTNNSTGDLGGGGAILSENILTLNDCTLSNNTARTGGGIRSVYTGVDTVYLNNCAIVGNSAVKGGGIYFGFGAQMTNCIIAGNTAHEGNYVDASMNTAEGGGLFNALQSPQIKLVLRFCSLSGNSAKGPKGQGGALENDGNAVLTNDILWGNDATNAAEIGTPANGAQTTTVTYCDIQGGLSGIGNIKANPLFVSTANPIMPPIAVINVGNSDLHLQAGSPCRGAGITIGPAKADPNNSNAKPDPGVFTDADEQKRPSPPSIGAYEYSSNPPKPKKVFTLDVDTANAAGEVGPVADAAAAPGAAPQAPGIPFTQEHPTLAAPPVGPQPRLDPQQENAAFLQLMVTLNTGHYAPSDMAQRIQTELDRGADINVKDGEGFPAIVTAASLSHTDVVQVLLEKGADANRATEQVGKSGAADSNSILHKTANGYQVDIGSAISGLFAKKPKPLYGQTALMLAAQSGQAEMATLLLAHHADSHAKDSRGKSALDYAAQNHRDDIAQVLRAQEAK